MTTFTNDDDETEKLIKKTDPLRGKKPDPQENKAPIEPESTAVDPLQELRQNLFSEENPQDGSQNDVFKRMTESLSNRRPTKRPKDTDGSEPVFGVRTAGNAPFEPEDNQDSVADWNKDTVILQNAPKSDAFTQDWPRTRPKNTSEDLEGTYLDEDQEHPTSEGESKVRPLDPNEQDTIWEGYSSENAAGQRSQSSKLEEKISQTQGGRKRLPSGFDRQQQVSRFISYNPKRSTKEQFQELSKVEKALIIALGIALVGLVGLIAYLFIESRQPGFGLDNRMIAKLTPSATVSPPIPSGLILPGGWSFTLRSGVMVDGEWNPKTSEWLMGTEVRRVVALQWNKQLEAVVRSFEAGDVITLQMSNGDSFPYKVLTVSEIPVEDTSMLYDVRPTLAVILIKPDAEKRWIVVAEPQ